MRLRVWIQCTAHAHTRIYSTMCVCVHILYIWSGRQNHFLHMKLCLIKVNQVLPEILSKI